MTPEYAQRRQLGFLRAQAARLGRVRTGLILLKNAEIREARNFGERATNRRDPPPISLTGIETPQTTNVSFWPTAQLKNLTGTARVFLDPKRSNFGVFQRYRLGGDLRSFGNLSSVLGDEQQVLPFINRSDVDLFSDTGH